MKTKTYLILFILIPFILFSCDDETASNEDPQGTITVTLNGLDSNAEGHATIFFDDISVDAVRSELPIEPIRNRLGYLHITSTDRFSLSAAEDVAIYTYDHINSLRDMDKMPEDGFDMYLSDWHISFHEKAGYIFRFKKGDKYVNVRLLIDRVTGEDAESYDDFTVEVKYQYPFLP